MKQFNFYLTPAKAYDLSLVFKIQDINLPSFLNPYLENFEKLSFDEKIMQRLIARKGRLLFISKNVFDTPNVLKIFNQYKKMEKIDKIMIPYYYRPYHEKKKSTEYILNNVSRIFEISLNDISLNEVETDKNILVITSHTIDLLEAVCSYRPQYIISFGIKHSKYFDLDKVQRFVKYRSAVFFFDKSINIEVLSNLNHQVYTLARSLINDGKSHIFLPNFIENNENNRENKNLNVTEKFNMLAKFLGIEILPDF